MITWKFPSTYKTVETQTLRNSQSGYWRKEKGTSLNTVDR